MQLDDDHVLKHLSAARRSMGARPGCRVYELPTLLGTIAADLAIDDPETLAAALESWVNSVGGTVEVKEALASRGLRAGARVARAPGPPQRRLHLPISL